MCGLPRWRRAVTVVHLRDGFFFVSFHIRPAPNLVLSWPQNQCAAVSRVTHTHFFSLFVNFFFFDVRARFLACAFSYNYLRVRAMTKEISFECNRVCSHFCVYCPKFIVQRERMWMHFVARCRPFTSVHCAHAHQVKKKKN